MQCNKCKDYRPKNVDGYNWFICLACGQMWRRWKIGEDNIQWYNDGVADLKTGEIMSDNKPRVEYISMEE